MNPLNYLQSLLNKPKQDMTGMGNMPDGMGAKYAPQVSQGLDIETDNPLMGRSFRPMPFENEDEFAEWKTAKMNNTPTRYGKIAQAQYDNRMFPQLADKYTAALDALKKGWGY